MILLIGTVQSMAALKPWVSDVNHKLKRTSAGRADPDVFQERALRNKSNGKSASVQECDVEVGFNRRVQPISLIQHADQLFPLIPNCEGAKNRMSIVRCHRRQFLSQCSFSITS